MDNITEDALEQLEIIGKIDADGMVLHMNLKNV